MDAKQCVSWAKSDVEFDVIRLKASDLLLLLVVDISEDGVRALEVCQRVSLRLGEKTYRWDLLGQINLLCQDHFALFERTFEVNVLEFVAEVDCLFDQGDKAPLDLKVHSGTLFDPLEDSTLGADLQFRSPRDKPRMLVLDVKLEIMYKRTPQEGSVRDLPTRSPVCNRSVWRST